MNMLAVKLTIQQISKYTELIYNHFDNTVAVNGGLFLPRENFYSPQDNSIIHLQEMTSTIIDKLNLPKGRVLVYYTSNINHAGHIEFSNRNEYYIEINSEYIDDYYSIGGILAHELMHLFLEYHKLWLEKKDENELLTDFATIYFGLGILVLNGQREVHEKNLFGEEKIQTKLLGYILPGEFAHLFVRYIKNQFIDDEDDVLLALTDTAKQYYYMGLGEYKQENKYYLSMIRKYNRITKRYNLFCKYLMKYFQIKNEFAESTYLSNSNMILRCRYCFQKYKMPLTSGQVKIKCKRCGTTFTVKLVRPINN